MPGHLRGISSSFKPGHAVTGVAQWIEWQPANPKVASSIPGGAHAWVTGQVPIWGCARGNQSMYFSHIDISLPPFLPPFPF